MAIDGPFGRTLDSLNVLLGNSHPAPRPVRRFPTNGCRVNVAHQHWPDGDTAAFFKGASATATEALATAGLKGHRDAGLAIGSVSGMDFDSLDDRSGVTTAGVNALARYCHDRLGLNGPLVHVMSACTSSGAALFWARSILQNGDADVMVAGGADRIRAVDYAGFNILRAMDPDGTRPFHARRAGITMAKAPVSWCWNACPTRGTAARPSWRSSPAAD